MAGVKNRSCRRGWQTCSRQRVNLLPRCAGGARNAVTPCSDFSPPAMLELVISRLRIAAFAALALAVSIAACHKEEQAVVGVAQNAEKAQQQAQAAAAERESQRAELAGIPLPTKSLYVNIHDPSEWANPFISADADYLDLRVQMADANPSTMGKGSMLRPAGARRQEMQIRPPELAKALLALPAGAWRYGRVVAIAESPLADRKERAQVRRNVEAAIQKLNDLGVVVEEWPAR